MIGLSPQCYIPSFMTIGLLVPEKIFEEFLPYMGMVAIWSCDVDPREQTFVLHSMDAPHEIWLQLAQWFQEMFENVDRLQKTRQ